MKKKERVPVVFATDDGYAMPTGVAITSLIFNALENTYYEIFIISSGLSKKNIDLLNKYSQKYPDMCNITILFPENKYINAHTERNLTAPNYYRFLIPELIQNYEKIIWCDVDMVINCDLSHLLKIDMEGKHILAVKKHDSSNYAKALFEKGFNVDENNYFNAGFFVWDINLARNTNVVEEINILVINNKFRFPTQDPMNIVFNNKVKYLSNKYNFLPTFYDFLLNCNNQELLRKHGIENDKDIFEPCIIHWAGPKPWIDDYWGTSIVFYQDYWWEYYRKSVFFDYKYYNKFQKSLFLLSTTNKWYRFGEMTTKEKIKAVIRIFKKKIMIRK